MYLASGGGRKIVVPSRISLSVTIHCESDTTPKERCGRIAPAQVFGSEAVSESSSDNSGRALPRVVLDSVVLLFPLLWEFYEMLGGFPDALGGCHFLYLRGVYASPRKEAPHWSGDPGHVPTLCWKMAFLHRHSPSAGMPSSGSKSRKMPRCPGGQAPRSPRQPSRCRQAFEVRRFARSRQVSEHFGKRLDCLASGFRSNQSELTKN